jgi:hypothetical protein
MGQAEPETLALMPDRAREVVAACPAEVVLDGPRQSPAWRGSHDGTFALLLPDVAAESHRQLIERFLPALRVYERFIVGYGLAGAIGRPFAATLVG